MGFHTTRRVDERSRKARNASRGCASFNDRTAAGIFRRSANGIGATAVPTIPRHPPTVTPPDAWSSFFAKREFPRRIRPSTRGVAWLRSNQRVPDAGSRDRSTATQLISSPTPELLSRSWRCKSCETADGPDGGPGEIQRRALIGLVLRFLAEGQPPEHACQANSVLNLSLFDKRAQTRDRNQLDGEFLGLIRTRIANLFGVVDDNR